MSLIVCNEIADYWSKKEYMPEHWVTAYVSRDRFQELHIRVRLHEKRAQGPYAKVSKAPLSFSKFTNELLTALGRRSFHPYSRG